MRYGNKIQFKYQRYAIKYTIDIRALHVYEQNDNEYFIGTVGLCKESSECQ